MYLLVVLSTLVFLFSAFLVGLPTHIANPVIAYLFYFLTLLTQYMFFFVSGFLFLYCFFNRKRFIHKYKKHPHPHPGLPVVHALTSVATGVLFSFAALFVIALIELNIFSILMNTNPKVLGITTDTKTIVQKLQQNSKPPQIIASDESSQQAVIAVAAATAGTTNFYSGVILQSIPNFLILPIKSFSSSFLFLDNTLIVVKMEKADLQTISPQIGYLFVQSYFPDVNIRSFPKISIVDEKGYQKFAINDTKIKLKKIDQELQTINAHISSLSAVLQKGNDAIAANSKTQKDVLQGQTDAYNKCVSTGTYVGGVFTPSNSSNICQSVLASWEPKIEAQATQADKLSNQLQENQQELVNYQYYQKLFAAQKQILAISTSYVNSELGVFTPSNSIEIVVNGTDSHKIADYFETLCHEYLHYASYTPTKRFDSAFFEEGLTEYFARKTIQDSLHIDTNIGYPVAVKVIEGLANRIADADLANIYFTKDELGLEKELDLAYGDNFYKDNAILFASLQYSSDPKQTLQLANTLMKKIGSNPLSKKDLYSSDSNL